MLKTHYPAFDTGSFELGMIEAFCEMVAQQVKPLALSPIIDMDRWPQLSRAAMEITQRFGVQCYEETDLIASDLAPDEAVKGHMVVLYYRDSAVLDGYLALKGETQALLRQGRYDAEARRAASIRFRRLLGYPQAAIDAHYGTN